MMITQEVTIQTGEGIQVLKYEHGQKYDPHFDYFFHEVRQTSSRVVCALDRKSGESSAQAHIQFAPPSSRGCASVTGCLCRNHHQCAWNYAMFAWLRGRCKLGTCLHMVLLPRLPWGGANGIRSASTGAARLVSRSMALIECF